MTMKTEASQPVSVAQPLVQPSSGNPTSPPGKAWSLNFKAPEPPAMTSERLKARAELVRNAANCGHY